MYTVVSVSPLHGHPLEFHGEAEGEAGTDQSQFKS